VEWLVLRGRTGLPHWFRVWRAFDGEELTLAGRAYPHAERDYSGNRVAVRSRFLRGIL